MTRLLTLVGLLAPSVAALAQSPVPASPAAPGGSLSQSLPSVLSSAQYAAPAPPVMVSQPAWGPVCPPAYGPVCPTPQPLLAPRMFRMPTPMPVAQAYDAGCGSRGNLVDRLRAWLCGGPGPALQPSRVWATPMRPWVPGHMHIVGEEGAAGWPSKCEGAGCQRLPIGGGLAAPACAPAAIGPRPIHIPLPSSADCAPTGECRPGLLRRILARITPDWFGGSRVSMASGSSAPMSSGWMVPPVQTAEPLYAPVPLATGGYHFAAPVAVPTQPVPVQSYPASQTPVPNQPPPVSAAPAAQPAPPPAVSPAAAASQPFTRQR